MKVWENKVINEARKTDHIQALVKIVRTKERRIKVLEKALDRIMKRALNTDNNIPDYIYSIAYHAKHEPLT